MTDQLRQAAQQALEALETCREDEWHSEDDFGMEQTYDEDKVAKALTALRTTLKQPVQDPVACRFCHSEKGSWTWQCYHCGEIDDVQQPAPLPVQEDFCFCHDGVSLQIVSGGAAPEGYLGKVTLLIDGKYVDYVKALKQPVQEPVNPTAQEMHNAAANLALMKEMFGDANQPAARPWVGLTEDEKFEIAAAQYGWEDLLAAAEAKLKERNYG